MSKRTVGSIWIDPLLREEIPTVHNDLDTGDYWIDDVPVPVGSGYAFPIYLDDTDVAARSGELLTAWLRQLAERIHAFVPEYALTVTFEVNDSNLSFPFTRIF